VAGVVASGDALLPVEECAEIVKPRE